MNINESVNLYEIAAKVGLTPPVSVLDVASKIGFEKRPIDLHELNTAVEKYLSESIK